MRSGLAFVVAMAFHLIVIAKAAERSVFSLPASASVLATVATTEDRLLLLVLWRGSPGWHSRSGSQAGGSGGGRRFSSTGSFGDRTVSVSFDSATGEATIQWRPVSMSPNKNVILVDGVDTADGGRVVSTFAIDPSAVDIQVRNRFAGLAPLLSRSPLIVEFLQCDAERIEPRSDKPCALPKKK